MGLKKFDENSTNQIEENIEQSQEDKINALIDENTKKEEEFKNLPLNEQENIIVERINSYRKDYNAYVKKQKYINFAIVGVLLALMITAFVLIIVLGETYPWLMYLSLGIVVVALIATFVFNKIFRNKLNERANDYIGKVCNETAKYLYQEPDFTNLQVLPDKPLQDSVFFDAHIYKDLKGTKSRNLVFANYNGLNFASADLAGFILVNKRTAPMFLGKIFEVDNNYNLDGKYILFQLKGGQLSRPIDDVDDLTLVEGNDIYCIYSNDENWRAVLNKKVLTELRKFNIDSTLIDVIVSIRKGKTLIGIDYEDNFINIPVSSDFEFHNTRRVKEDLNIVLNVVDLINKK